MKIVNSLIIIASMAFFMACGNTANNSDKTSDKVSTEQTSIEASKVTVYYFHTSRRCETCLAVEGVSSKAIKDFYKGTIGFESFNIEEDDGAKMAEKMGVSSSALIIKRGDQKIDITPEAFMYGREQGEKLRELIKAKIEPVKNL
jgi:hypothetical protein